MAISALRVHGSDPTLIARILAALGNMSVESSCRGGMASVIGPVVAVLGSHPEEPEVVERALRCLANLATHSPHGAALLASLPSYLSALGPHASLVTVERGLGLLANLSTMPEHRAALGPAVPVVCEAMVREGPLSLLAGTGLFALRNLSTLSDFGGAVLVHGLAPVLDVLRVAGGTGGAGAAAGAGGGRTGPGTGAAGDSSEGLRRELVEEALAVVRNLAALPQCRAALQPAVPVVAEVLRKRGDSGPVAKSGLLFLVGVALEVGAHGSHA